MGARGVPTLEVLNANFNGAWGIPTSEILNANFKRCGECAPHPQLSEVGVEMSPTCKVAEVGAWGVPTSSIFSELPTSKRIITIDGPSSSGKGTIARLLANKLGWHILDSGALYRALGFIALQRHLLPTDPIMPTLAANLTVKFIEDQAMGKVGGMGVSPTSSEDGVGLSSSRVFMDDTDISMNIRTEIVGDMASQIAAIPTVRAALLARQQAYAQWPGLVADGRDMGTLVFPTAQLKIFLTASPEERAKRRYNQLKANGFSVNISDLAAALRDRDERDRARSIAPLKAAAAALEVDSTGRSIADVQRQILAQVMLTFPDLYVQS